MKLLIWQGKKGIIAFDFSSKNKVKATYKKIFALGKYFKKDDFGSVVAKKISGPLDVRIHTKRTQR